MLAPGVLNSGLFLILRTCSFSNTTSEIERLMLCFSRGAPKIFSGTFSNFSPMRSIHSSFCSIKIGQMFSGS